MMKKTFFLASLLLACLPVLGGEPMRIGIIGLDTSHSIAFTKVLNDKQSEDHFVKAFEVVAAYPYGTANIESATSRIPKYIEEIQQYGVSITGSVSELLDTVDIDKPLGATLGQAIAIYEMADRYGVRFFSSSAVRFTVKNVNIRGKQFGNILGADVYSPHSVEKTHPDFGYYGIHGVEELFTVMGTGCKSVSRTHTDQGDVVVGVWDGERIGTFRAITKGPYIYGGTAISEKQAVSTGGYTGYKVLLDEILKFFETDELPFPKEETLELFTFMKASNMSLEKGGKPVSMEKAWKAGLKDSRKLLKKYGK